MGYFFVEKILINTCNLQDSFLVGIPPIIVERRVQDMSVLGFLETTHATKVTYGFRRPFRLGSFALRNLTVLSPLRPCYKFVYFKESNRRISYSSKS